MARGQEWPSPLGYGNLHLYVEDLSTCLAQADDAKVQAQRISAVFRRMARMLS